LRFNPLLFNAAGANRIHWLLPDQRRELRWALNCLRTCTAYTAQGDLKGARAYYSYALSALRPGQNGTHMLHPWGVEVTGMLYWRRRAALDRCGRQATARCFLGRLRFPLSRVRSEVLTAPAPGSPWVGRTISDIYRPWCLRSLTCACLRLHWHCSANTPHGTRQNPRKKQELPIQHPIQDLQP
jgi:hypothetical protein